MTVKGNHPLSEIIAQKLFGIESVPPKEQKRMVSRACKAAVQWHNAEIERKDEALKKIKDMVAFVKKGEGYTLKITGTIYEASNTAKTALSAKEGSDGNK